MIIVDDAHVDSDLMLRVLQLRRELSANFTILARRMAWRPGAALPKC